MFSAFSQLLNPRISPCSWCPSDPVPSGSTSTTQHLKLPLSSLSSLSFTSAGSWAHGTICFDVGEGRNPPSYDIAVTAPHAMRDEKASGGQLADGEGFLEVTVESRWNDQSLSEESTVALNRVGQYGVELRVHTPNMSPFRLTSQLSYHITFILPSTLSSLSHLRTQGAQWRTLGSDLLESIYFDAVVINTANALVNFSDLRTDKLEIKTANAVIEGKYQVGKGGAKISTSNKPVEGSFESEASLEVSTCNATITGNFKAFEKLSISTWNASIAGEFEANQMEVKTSNATIGGNWKVRESLRLTTSNASIDVDVNLLGEDDERAGTPDLLPVDSKASGSGQSIRKSKIYSVVQTSNNRVDVRYKSQAEGVELDSSVTSSNAAIVVRHAAGFVGLVKLYTANSKVVLELPSTHQVQKTTSPADGTALEGTISLRGNNGGVSPDNRSRISTSNGGVLMIVG